MVHAAYGKVLASADHPKDFERALHSGVGKMDTALAELQEAVRDEIFA
jgi:hypothetical protein